MKAETRRYDENKNVTVFMRKKNTKVDYKYFTDATIAPVMISQQLIDEALNYKPNSRIDFDFLTKETIDEINNEPYLIHLFTLLKDNDIATLKVSNFVLTRVRSEIRRHGSGLMFNIENDLLMLLTMLEEDRLTYKQASIVYQRLIKAERKLDDILNEYNFTNQYEDDELSSIIDETLLQYIDAVKDYKNGKNKALNFLLGQIYKRTKNNIDSIKAKEMLLNKMEEY